VVQSSQDQILAATLRWTPFYSFADLGNAFTQTTFSMEFKCIEQPLPDRIRTIFGFSMVLRSG
jgi:hypothetical protein